MAQAFARGATQSLLTVHFWDPNAMHSGRDTFREGLKGEPRKNSSPSP
jgi:hypothetical protein